MTAGEVLFGRTRRALLALFFTRPDESFYLREVARRTGIASGAVQREVRQLLACGIVRRPRDRYFQANEHSPIYEPLKRLVVRTIGVADVLRDSIAGVRDRIEVGLIFGSFARGEHHAESDVDVLIITRPGSHLSAGDAYDILRPVQQLIGREVNPFVLSTDEWRAKATADSPLVRRVLDEPKVFFVGGEDELKRVAAERVGPADHADGGRRARPARAGRLGPAQRKRRGAR